MQQTTHLDNTKQTRPASIADATIIKRIHSMRHLRVLVIGDAMLDTYFEGTATRLCSEGPVPVISKIAEYHLPGGAANTAANLQALGATVDFLSIIGKDRTGEELRNALHSYNVNDQWLIEDPNVYTLHKLRIQANGQYIVRLDEGGLVNSSFTQTSNERQITYSLTCQKHLLAHLETLYNQCDLVVVSDYGYGVMSQEIIEYLRTLHEACPKVLLIDSKMLHHFRDMNATVVTPNYQEARLLFENLNNQTKRNIVQDHQFRLEEVKQLGRQLLPLLAAKNIVITLANHGAYLFDRLGNALHLPTASISKANDIGAGDTFASTLALMLATGSHMEEAAQIGIEATKVVIMKQRTSVVWHQELLQRINATLPANKRTHFIASKQGEPITFSQLKDYLEQERQAGHTIIFTNGVFDLLHVGHIQLLHRAKKLGDILIVGINSDISTKRLKGEQRPINTEQNRMALIAALGIVNYAVIFEEDTPNEIIRSLRPHIHVKGGDYADKILPEAEAVLEVGGHTVFIPIVEHVSTTHVINHILSSKE